jgi:hypothetical protein
MGAASGPVADIVGTEVAVVRAGRAAWGIAVVGGLVTGVVADRTVAARIAGMDGTASPAAGVGTVAVETVVAGSGVVGVDAS